MWNIFKKKIPNSLTFYIQSEHSDGYSEYVKFKEKNIDDIILKSKKSIKNTDNYGISIESKFNDLNYPFFDLDYNHIDLFKKLYSDTPYVIFISSVEQYKYQYGRMETISENIH